MKTVLAIAFLASLSAQAATASISVSYPSEVYENEAFYIDVDVTSSSGVTPLGKVFIFGSFSPTGTFDVWSSATPGTAKVRVLVSVQHPNSTISAPQPTSLYVRYEGDSNHSSVVWPGPFGQNGGTILLKPQPYTVTTLDAPSAGLVAGTPFSLTAHVTTASGNAVDGTVGISSTMNSTTDYLGGMSFFGTVATRPYTLWQAGTQALTAELKLNLAYRGSVSAPVTVTVAKAQPTVSVSANRVQVLDTNPVTFTASLTGARPSGTVTFFDGATSLGSAAVSNSVASKTVSFATTAVHSVYAVYSGDSNNLSAQSSAVAITVTPRPATTSSVVATPSTPYELQTTSLAVTVSGNAPTGSVTLKVANQSIGFGTLSNGATTIQAAFPSAGSYSVQVVYDGDLKNAPSTTTWGLTVAPRYSSVISLASSASPAALGAAVTLTATLTGLAPNSGAGKVSFYDGATLLKTVDKDASNRAVLSTAFVTGGTHALSAMYAGNVSDRPVTSSTLNQQVLRNVTSCALTVTPNPTYVGQQVALSAALAGTWAGPYQVRFRDGTTVLQTVTSNTLPVATTIVFATTGTHAITAEYLGDISNVPSTSTSVPVTVGPAVAPSPDPVMTLKYDAQGNQTEVGISHDGGTVTTTVRYDTLDQPHQVTDALANVSQFGFEYADSLEWVMDTRNLVTDYRRNGFGDPQVLPPVSGKLSPRLRLKTLLGAMKRE